MSVKLPRLVDLPPRLVESAQRNAEGQAWLDQLAAVRERLARRWSLVFEREGGGQAASCSYVARVRRADGTRAVLKIGLPHMEAEHEAHGLRFWNGHAMIGLLEADEASGGLLLERCEPGSPLSDQPEPERDRIIAGLLLRLWQAPPPTHPFRPLSAMVRHWADIALDRPEVWPDAGFVRAGIDRLIELAEPGTDDRLLATDLHAGNVLAARREAWLAIDPKPFLGDRTYDATQHLLNCTTRLCSDPYGTVASFAQRINVKQERVHAWLFARLAAHVQRGRLTFGLDEQEVMVLARKHEKLASRALAS